MNDGPADGTEEVSGVMDSVIAPEQNPPDPHMSFVIGVSLWSGDDGVLRALVTEPGDTQPSFTDVPAQFAAMLPTVLGQLRQMRGQ